MCIRDSGQLNVQKQQLEQEITDRKVIEADLRATQDELCLLYTSSWKLMMF